RSDLSLLVALSVGLGDVSLNAALLFDVSGDDLGGNPSRESAMLAALEEAGDDDLRIASRRHADEPAVVLVLGLLFGAHLGLQLVRNCLGATGFPGKVHAVNMCAPGGPH